MKTFTLTLFIGLSISIFQLNAQQVVFSSGFENWTTGSYPNGWGGAGTTLSVDSLVPYTSNPHSGAIACRIKKNTQTTMYSDTLYAADTIQFQKGHKYELKFWKKGKGIIKVYFYSSPISVNSLFIQTNTAIDSTWKEYSKLIVCDNDYTVRPYIVIYKTYSAYEDIQIDDITVYDYGLFQTALDTNNIAATVNANGALFWDMHNAAFEVPKGSGHMSLFAAALWLGGLDANDSLHMAATRYFQLGADLQTGPLANDYTSTNYISKYHKLWKVNKSDIDYHMSHYNSSGYVIPESIATWPGNGDVSNGEAHILAPFADLNENGIYEPGQGEYPYIRGDQAVYFILNDDMIHTETQGKKFGIEEHIMLYSYNQPSDSALFNTVFLTYNVINRSDTNYHDVYAGLWTDADLGDASDDYIGCDSVNNFFVVYNGDEMDGDGNGITYGTHPPAQGIAFMNYTMNSFLYFINGSSASALGDPSTAVEYYRMLRGYWKDGTHMTYGGTGYGGTVPVNYMFSGTYYGSWSEFSEINTPGDRRGVGSVGPIDLPAHSDLCVELAFPFARDYTGTAFSSAQLLRQRVQEVKTFYDNQNFDCMNTPYSVPPLSADAGNISVFPNPSNGIYTFHQTEYKGSLQVKVYNTLGQCIFSQKSQNNDWQVNISRNSDGMYFYTVSNNDGKVIKNGKLIKN